MMTYSKPFFVLICSMFFSFNALAELTLNSAAPSFDLYDQVSTRHQLADYAGKWLVLYFYPKDDTPGCTKEACNFRDDIYQIRGTNAEVLGVSTDNIESHAEFAKKYSLPFALLADTNAKVAKSYGAAWKLGPLSIAKRHSFIISPDGMLVKIYRKVDPKVHSDQIIAVLKALQTIE